MATKYKKAKKKVDGPKIICQNKDCIYMGKHQTPSNFYKSRNEAMPHHPYCKDCVNKLADGSNIQNVYDVLRVLDTPFIMDIWNETLQNNTTNFLGHYIAMINRRRKYDGLTFNDSIFEITEEVKEVAEKVQSIIDDKPIWNDFWQGEYSKSDLAYLDDYYSGLMNDFKIVTTNHKDYAKK